MGRALPKNVRRYAKLVDTRFTIGTTTGIANWIEQLADAGIDYAIVCLPDVACDHEHVRRFAEIPDATVSGR